jgi:hypothetical protein
MRVNLYSGMAIRMAFTPVLPGIAAPHACDANPEGQNHCSRSVKLSVPIKLAALLDVLV